VLHSVDDSIKRVLAYLVLIGINKNEQRVKAVAANYRRPVSRQWRLVVPDRSACKQLAICSLWRALHHSSRELPYLLHAFAAAVQMQMS